MLTSKVGIAGIHRLIRALALLAVLGAAIRPCAGQALRWTPVSFHPRFEHALAYDSARRAVVLFGGKVGSTTLTAGLSGETWEFQDGTWTLRSMEGPTPRSRHAMAYDEARGVVVLFGGSDASGSNGDTWEWDGESWRLRDLPGPSPRSGHAMSYDSQRAVTVLFGGSNAADISGETWEFNGLAWTLRSAAGPSPRVWHKMAYDVGRGQTVLFGGWDGGWFATGLWEWDGVDWSLVSGQHPSPRHAHSMCYDRSRGVVVLYDGRLEYPWPNLTWEWNGSVWVARDSGPSIPVPQGYGAMVFDDRLGEVLFVGGALSNSRLSGETWRWNGATWSLETAGVPLPRYGAGMVFDERRGVTVLFGGRSFSARHADTWEWDGTVWRERHVPGPSARSAHVMAYDSIRGVTVLFGGATGSPSTGVLNAETWEYNGESWTIRATSGPSARAISAMAFDSRRGVSVLFGGEIVGGYSAQTWEWDGDVWVRRVDLGTSGFRDHTMAYDSARGVTVLWGGGGQRLLGEWDGVAWTQLSGLPAPPDNGARMVFDSSRGLTVLAGGDTGNSGLFGTWERGSGWWTGVGLVGPAGRARSALAYDTRRNAAVMFGGVGNALFGDTWEYSCLGVRAESLNRLVCPGGRATLVARTPDDDTSPRTYQWRRGPLREVIPGANERAFTIDPVGPSQVGVYDCVVTTDCGVTTSGPVMVEVCVADFVCDGVLGFSDYAAFVDCFEQPDCARGDLNLDGVVDFFDYDDFVGAFEAGC